MIKGVGIDAVEKERIAQIVKEKPRFAARILTSNELAYYEQLSFHRQVEFLGGRFACKEAFSKAWGTGIGKVGFQEIEVLTNELGAPIVTNSPFQSGCVHVSITHTQTTIFAQIILEE
ncbi:holo-ACP synthase [Enterococcus camelliae]|jgi:holo-[acyl-carrier protein] synthase|uniref:Holo-[acyl-carrier-protein] synthase n=1 Tax=Enterococcus camelliae TaxID=453959 RepID=A0ABW5TKQ6_9ENTE